MKTQTAVEKFIEQLEEQGESWENVSIGRIQISIKVEDYLDLIKQAKEMENEQHGNTWDAAIQAHEDRGHVLARSYCDFDDYFNETYGDNK
jgi:hypothetical protein